MEASKNSAAYRTVKNLVDNFKTQELEKYRLEHPEEKGAIPKGIVLDCNSRSSASASTKVSDKSSSSDEIKVVNKNVTSFFLSNSILWRGTKMSDETMEIIRSSKQLRKQARLTTDNITAKVDEIGTERSYISQGINK